jgi:hypothetical protein
MPTVTEGPMGTEQTDKLKKESRLEMRVDTSWLKRIDDWRRQQDEIPSRAEALRRLTDIGLRQAG